MNITFSELVKKLVELDSEIIRHNSIIDDLKNSWLEEEQKLAVESNKNQLMNAFQLNYSVSSPLLDQYKISRMLFLKQMIEMQYLIDQVKALIKAFLNYDVIIDDLDVSKKLRFDVAKILGRFSMYPKRLTFLYKQKIIDDHTYNSMYNECWLKQNDGASNMFYGLIIQYKKLRQVLITDEVKNKDVHFLSEVIFKMNIVPSMTMVTKVIEYLFAPKIDLLFEVKTLVLDFGYPTEESLMNKIDNIYKII